MTLDALPNAFSYSLAHERGVSDRRLRGLVADGVLERLGPGLYRKADALSLHDLTDAIPSEIDEGLSLGVYSAERSVIDTFRLRHQEGEDLAVEALRRWLKRPGATPADLLAMARSFPKVEPSLLQALRILS